MWDFGTAGLSVDHWVGHWDCWLADWKAQLLVGQWDYCWVFVKGAHLGKTTAVKMVQ